MGILLSSHTKVRSVFSPWLKLTPTQVHELYIRRFFRSKRNGSFGFNISYDLFSRMFADLGDDVTLRKMWLHIGGNRGLHEGECNVLRVFSAMITVSRGYMAEKLDALFDLFDFEAAGVLKRDRLLYLIDSTVHGYASIGYHGASETECKELSIPNMDELDIFLVDSQANTKMPKFQTSYDPDDVMELAVHSNEVCLIVTMFGTLDKEAMMAPHLSKRSNSEMLDVLYDKLSIKNNPKHRIKIINAKSRIRTKLKKNQRHRFYFNVKSAERDVKHLKVIFDFLDTQKNGFVPLEYLKKPPKMIESYLIRDVSQVFMQLSVGVAPPQVSFVAMLEILYPDLSAENKELMLSWVPPAVTRDLCLTLQREFDMLDTDFTGKVYVKDFLSRLEKNHKTSAMMKYFNRAINHDPVKNVRMTLHGLEHLIFSRITTRSVSKQLAKWTKPSRLLSAKHQDDLRILFDSYDPQKRPLHEKKTSIRKQTKTRKKKKNLALDTMKDEDEEDDEYIPYGVFRKSLTDMGLSGKEIDDQFSVFFDGSDQSKDKEQVSFQMFKIFYRDYWDTQINFHTAQGIKHHLTLLQEEAEDERLGKESVGWFSVEG